MRNGNTEAAIRRLLLNDLQHMLRARRTDWYHHYAVWLQLLRQRRRHVDDRR